MFFLIINIFCVSEGRSAAILWWSSVNTLKWYNVYIKLYNVTEYNNKLQVCPDRGRRACGGLLTQAGLYIIYTCTLIYGIRVSTLDF